MVQTWTGSAGTITVHFAYLIDSHTITTIKVTAEGALAKAAVDTIVAQAADNL